MREREKVSWWFPERGFRQYHIPFVGTSPPKVSNHGFCVNLKLTPFQQPLRDMTRFTAIIPSDSTVRHDSATWFSPTITVDVLSAAFSLGVPTFVLVIAPTFHSCFFSLRWNETLLLDFYKMHGARRAWCILGVPRGSVQAHSICAWFGRMPTVTVTSWWASV